MSEAELSLATKGGKAAWEEWRNRLLSQWQQLAEQETESMLFLLVDARAKPGLDRLLMQVPGVAWTSLWHGSENETYTDIAPYLIQIERLALVESPGLEGRLIRRLWMEGQSCFMLTWLWSPMTLDALDRHLKYYTRYATPDKREFFLHFYDNRILARLREVWTDAQARSFIAPCREIWYRERDFSEIVWRNDELTMPVPADERLQISADQQAMLYVLGHADKLAMQLREMYGCMLDEFGEAELHQRVSEQIKRAGRYRLKDDSDLLNYVTKGIMFSPRFDEHPVMQARLERTLSGEISHREALIGVDRHVLREMAEMNGSYIDRDV